LLSVKVNVDGAVLIACVGNVRRAESLKVDVAAVPEGDGKTAVVDRCNVGLILDARSLGVDESPVRHGGPGSHAPIEDAVVVAPASASINNSPPRAGARYAWSDAAVADGERRRAKSGAVVGAAKDFAVLLPHDERN